MIPSPAELNLTFFVYVAALQGQRLGRNYHKTNNLYWRAYLKAVKSWLNENGMYL